jgi:hypothetical protein
MLFTAHSASHESEVRFRSRRPIGRTQRLGDLVGTPTRPFTQATVMNSGFAAGRTAHDGGADLQPGHSLDDQRETVAPVEPAPSVEPHAVVIEPDDQSVPVVFDLVDTRGRLALGSMAWKGTTSGERRVPDCRANAAPVRPAPIRSLVIDVPF